MESKNLFIVFFVAVIVIVGFFGFNKGPDAGQGGTTATTLKATDNTEKTTETKTQSTQAKVEATLPEDIPLSEFQITACNAADRSGTCNTRLEKLRLVTKAECCQYLGKCCTGGS